MHQARNPETTIPVFRKGNFSHLCVDQYSQKLWQCYGIQTNEEVS